jgi:hypothetical protein
LQRDNIADDILGPTKSELPKDDMDLIREGEGFLYTILCQVNILVWMGLSAELGYIPALVLQSEDDVSEGSRVRRLTDHLELRLIVIPLLLGLTTLSGRSEDLRGPGGASLALICRMDRGCSGFGR